MRKATKFGALACACALAACMFGCSSDETVQDNGTDNTTLTETSLESHTEQSFETVTFGTYVQSGDEGAAADPIEWYVLDEQDGKTLLISAKVLEAKAYSDVDEGVTWSESSPRPTTDVSWEDSSLREWLNGEFLTTAFSADEQAAIQVVTNSDTKSNVAHTAETAADASVHATAETQDSVFLLSVSEAKRYFANNAARSAYPTDHALSQVVYTGVTTDASGQVDEEASGTAVWWLRTNGYYAGYESVVTDDGYVHGDGYRINGELHDGFADHGEQASELGGNVGVRPCIWVDASAVGR